MSKWVDYPKVSHLVAGDGEVIATVTLHRNLGSPPTYHLGLWGKFYNSLEAAKLAAEDENDSPPIAAWNTRFIKP